MKCCLLVPGFNNLILSLPKIQRIAPKALIEKYIYLFSSNIRKLLFIILFLIISTDSKASNDTTLILSVKKYLNKIISKPNYIINQPTVGLTYGLAPISSQSLKNPLASCFNTEIIYGFNQIDSNYDYPLVYKSNTQYTFLSNISSHFGPGTIQNRGLTTDSWRFGFGHTSGWGWDSHRSDLLLWHSGAFVFTHIDFEQYPNDQNDLNIYNHFDLVFKFGTSTSTGLNAKIYEILYADLSYEHSIVFPRFMPFKWMGSYFTELLLEKTIDVFDEKLLDRYEEFYPLVYFLMKNAVSFSLYELRRHQMNWPFSDASPMNYDMIKFGIALKF
ncbi:MAG: hypothetical protein NT007_12595 [Candidatus Kapabacteria bacterium]|nr:hypothetical protein [Candidatus Kapabacteria bacterium]